MMQNEIYIIGNNLSINTFQLLQKSNSQLLEPFMQLEIITEEETTPSVLADISRRRGNVLQVAQRQDMKVRLLF